MRRFSVLVVLALLALCVGLAAAQDIDPSGQTIVYWHQYNDGPQLETMNAFIEGFNSTNEWGIPVEGLPQGNYNSIRELMNGAIVSGETPNLVAGFTNDALSYASDGVVVDMNTFINDATWGFSAEDLADINDGILAIGRGDGMQVAWPNQTSAQVMVANLTMLAELGFEGAPSNFEDFIAASCAAAEMTGPNGEDIQGFPIKGDASEFESFVASRGGSIWVDGAWNFTNEDAIATFQLFQDMYSQGCAYIPDSQFGNTDDFALGLNPMATTSTAGIPFIRSGFTNSGVEADWVVVPTPWTEGNRTVQVFAPSIIMIKGTDEQDLAAWLFLKFLAEAEQQITWTTLTSYFSSRYSTQEALTALEESNPYFGAANALVNDPEINIYVSPQNITYGPVRGLISTAIADVTANNRNIGEVAAELEAAANALFDN